MWEGFWELSGSRQVVVLGGGMVPAVAQPQPLPFEVLQLWLDRRGFEGLHRAEAEHLLTYLDGVYRQQLTEQQASEEEESDG